MANLSEIETPRKENTQELEESFIEESNFEKEIL